MPCFFLHRFLSCFPSLIWVWNVKLECVWCKTRGRLANEDGLRVEVKSRWWVVVYRPRSEPHLQGACCSGAAPEAESLPIRFLVCCVVSMRGYDLLDAHLCVFDYLAIRDLTTVPCLVVLFVATSCGLHTTHLQIARHEVGNSCRPSRAGGRLPTAGSPRLMRRLRPRKAGCGQHFGTRGQWDGGLGFFGGARMRSLEMRDCAAG